jgi:hypothetical protein
VVAVNSNCDAPDGQVIDQVNAEYNAANQTINITCTFKPDEPAVGGGVG